MHLEIYPTHNHLNGDSIEDKNVVIIDVLRATSVIANALNIGALKIKTVASIEDAFFQKANYPELILGGERNAQKIAGFDLGNSPLEYSREKIANKTVLLCTTNGTQAVEKSKRAKRILAASFLNLKSVTDYLINIKEDTVVICSGTNGNFSLDDGLCAGLLLHELRKSKTISTNDFGELLLLPFENKNFDLKDTLKKASHSKYLESKGYGSDIHYCLDINRLNILPIWKNDGFIHKE